MRILRAFHPLLFAIFPVMSLYSRNADHLLFSEVDRSFWGMLIACLLLWIMAVCLLRRIEKAALLTSLFLILFFSFDSIRALVRGVEIPLGSFLMGPDKIALLILLIALGVSLAIVKRLKNIRIATHLFNVVGVSLFLLSALPLVTYQMKDVSPQESTSVSDAVAELKAEMKLPEKLPNIYFIILDYYGRDDVFREFLDANFDADEFFKNMSELGFVKADRSYSNYDQTHLSLASSLNFDYLTTSDMEACKRAIRENKTFEILRSVGYRIVSFDSGSSVTDVSQTVDNHIATNFFNLNDFETMLLQKTPVFHIQEGLNELQEKQPNLAKFIITRTPYDMHRDRIANTFKGLEQSAPTEKPTFFFAHIVSPHAPYVFGRNGEPIAQDLDFSFGGYEFSKKEYIPVYLDQVHHLNTMVEKMVKRILEQSQTPPIIIIQADHGSDFLNFSYKGKDPSQSEIRDGFKERMSILNLYYLPDGGAKLVYPSISPVNNFRVVLSHYFGLDLPLLEDHIYPQSLRGKEISGWFE